MVFETTLANRLWRSLLVILSIFLGSKLGSDFVPQLNEGNIALHAMRIPGTGIDQAVEMQKVLEQHIMKYDEVLTVFSKTGTAEVVTDAMPPNVTDTFLILKLRGQWPTPNLTKADFVERLEKDLSSIPGNNYEFTQPIQMRFNELISRVRADVGIKLYGDDLSKVVNTVQEILTALNKISGVADARLEQVDDMPIFTANPKPEALAL